MKAIIVILSIIATIAALASTSLAIIKYLYPNKEHKVNYEINLNATHNNS